MANGNAQRVTIKDVYDAVERLEKKVDDNYVKKEVFEARLMPLQKIIYGLVGAVLMGVVGSILALVLRGSP